MIVYKEEIVKWLKTLDPNRLFNFSESRVQDSCGCVMVQYAREKGIPFHTCGCRTWGVRSFITASLADCDFSSFDPVVGKNRLVTAQEIIDFVETKRIEHKVEENETN